MTDNDRDPTILCAAADEDVAPRLLASVRQGLGLPKPRRKATATSFVWRPGELEQRVAVSLPFDVDGIEHLRVASRIPVLREVTADPVEVEHMLASLNGLAHRSAYVFNPETRSIDAVQGMLVCARTLELSLPLVVASCRLQFQHLPVHRGRLQSKLGGREALDEWPVEAPLERPRRAANALRRAFEQPAPRGGNPFAEPFELEVIAEQANAGNAFSAGATGKGVAIDCPFDDATALVGLRTYESHPLVGEGLLAFIKVPIFGEEREIARIAGWLNRKEAAGEIPCDQSGAWTLLKLGNGHHVAHLQFLPASMYQPGVALRTALATLRKVRAVNALMNPGVPERNVLEVVEERLRAVRGGSASAG